MKVKVLKKKLNEKEMILSRALKDTMLKLNELIGLTPEEIVRGTWAVHEGTKYATSLMNVDDANLEFEMVEMED